jgi:hypothetical protein
MRIMSIALYNDADSCGARHHVAVDPVRHVDTRVTDRAAHVGDRDAIVQARGDEHVAEVVPSTCSSTRMSSPRTESERTARASPIRSPHPRIRTTAGEPAELHRADGGHDVPVQHRPVVRLGALAPVVLADPPRGVGAERLAVLPGIDEGAGALPVLGRDLEVLHLAAGPERPLLLPYLDRGIRVITVMKVGGRGDASIVT